MKTTIQMASTHRGLPSRRVLVELFTFLGRTLEIDKKSILLRIVDPLESQYLNKRFRQKDAPTNVLSFPEAPDFLMPKGSPPSLGELVMCHEVIDREALAQEKRLFDHYTHLVIHGLLHLLGYDHREEEEAEEMEALEIRLLQQLNIHNPYEDHPHGS